MKKFLVFMLALLIGSTVLACTTTASTTVTTTGTTEVPTVTTAEPIDYTTEVDLNVAINYYSGGKLMSISYNLPSGYTSTINTKTYTDGDLTPAWERIGEKLHINFIDATGTDTSTALQWTRLLGESFEGIDLVNGTGAQIAEEGVKGNFVNLAKYLPYMPNLSAFLTQNPSVKISMTSADGGIYFTPYFDGFGEMEQMFLVRVDWVEDILDATSPTFDTDPGVTLPTNYDRVQMPATLTTDIVVANQTTGTRIVEKSYTQNILTTLKNLVNPTGATMANAFRAYITATYGDQGYAKLSDVFCGSDAAYDTDELAALMYVVNANPKYLTREHMVVTAGVRTATPDVKSDVDVYFPREGATNRLQNLFRGMEMFGLRGVFSRCEWLYFDEEGLVQDIRHDQAFVGGVNDLAGMYQDGLIVQNPEGSTNWRKLRLEGANGFMTYDYNATSTTSDLINKGRLVDPTLKFQAILPPVVDWLGDGNYFHFTEAVRSVKGEAWGLCKAIEDETDKTRLFRAIKLIDELYDYSTDDSVGTIHLYGPAGYTDGTLTYGNDIVYQMSDLALDEMTDLAGGNMINYLRQYVGATLPIGHVRSLGLEFQTLTEEGEIGVARINKAVSAGVLLLAGNIPSTEVVGIDETNPWFQLSPTVYPLTKDASTQINAVSASFKAATSADSFITLLKNGFSGNGGSLTEAQYWATFKVGNFDVYETIYINSYRDAYEAMIAD